MWHGPKDLDRFLWALAQNGLQYKQEIIWVKSSITLNRMDYQWKHEPCLYGWKEGTHWFTPDRGQPTVEDPRPNISAMKADKLREYIKELWRNDGQTTILYEDKPIREDDHPTQKPIKLMARLVRNSTKPGETVLDIFGGSGSTLIACEHLGRKCLMMEYDPGYVDVIIRRWEALTGGKAIKIN